MTEKRLKFTWALLILVLLQIIMMLVLRFAADATGNFLKAANLADYITNIVGVFLGGYLFALWSEKNIRNKWYYNIRNWPGVQRFSCWC
ncbi:MAG: hypothetical protein HWD59_01005 [Coxiellaceae bacterium]|nr:MAG: hypothetical protein HWD59_01005 [Coxiellaceae bacterium]